jgi:tetratricopeptide (TPR) repeat protein
MWSPPRRASSRLARLLLTAAIGAPATVAAADVAALLAEGDAHYERRAQGAHGGTADPRETDLALQAYRRALAASPDDLAVLARLLRAVNFRGDFCGADAEARRRIFEEGRRLGQAAVERLEASVAANQPDGGRSGGRGPEQRLAGLRATPGAAGAYFWTAACWGQWALARGKLASARAGVAGRVRDLSETVIALDPALEEGGGYRVLGRLHDQAPRIPLLTGWVSRTKAIEYLRKAYALGPRNPVTWFFLAEALLDHDPLRADEGRGLLRRCVDTPPRADYYVESVRYAELARARLADAR